MFEFLNKNWLSKLLLLIFIGVSNLKSISIIKILIVNLLIMKIKETWVKNGRKHDKLL